MCLSLMPQVFCVIIKKNNRQMIKNQQELQIMFVLAEIFFGDSFKASTPETSMKKQGPN